MIFVLIAACLAGSAAAQVPTDSRKRISTPGALLDDYDGGEPGSFTLTFGAGYTKLPAGYDLTLPSFDLNMGLTRRLSVGISSGLSKSEFQLFRTTAIGDAYIDAKVVLLREGKRRPGIAFQPVLEVLGRPSLAENLQAPNKVNSALGGIIGKEFRDTVRVYNHSGYFSRGIVFSSSALEVTRFERITPAVFLTCGSLTRNRDLAAQQRLNASQVELGGSVSLQLSKHWSAYAGVQRGIGRRDLNSYTIGINGGISYTWKLRPE